MTEIDVQRAKYCNYMISIKGISRPDFRNLFPVNISSFLHRPKIYLCEINYITSLYSHYFCQIIEEHEIIIKSLHNIYGKREINEDLFNSLKEII